MGANNSTPKTVEFENPNVEANVITMTQQVANRIDKAMRQENGTEISSQITPMPYQCNNCAKEKNKQVEKSKGIVLNSYQKKLLETENDHFEDKFKELEDALQKPVNWAAENIEELKAMESDLLKCYKQYHGEPLHCHKNAKDYQNFIFEKQYEAILKHSQAAGDSANNEVK